MKRSFGIEGAAKSKFSPSSDSCLCLLSSILREMNRQDVTTFVLHFDSKTRNRISKMMNYGVNRKILLSTMLDAERTGSGEKADENGECRIRV